MSLRTDTRLNDDLIDDLQFHNDPQCDIRFARISNPDGSIHGLEVKCVFCMETLIEIENTEQG